MVAVGGSPAAVVNGPALTPAAHSLVASATVLTEPNDRWELGFSFTPEGCSEMIAFNDCWVDGGGTIVTGKSDPDRLDVIDYWPVTLELAVACASTGLTTLDFPGRAQRLAEAATSKALEREFWTGETIPDNPHLAASGATILGSSSAQQPIVALGMLNEALGDCATGGRGMIHAPGLAATFWSEYVTDEGQRLVTKVRHNVVVVGGGYPGTSPAGAAPVAGTEWVYATSMVAVRLSAIKILPDTIGEALDRRTNDLTYRAERSAAAIWDGCCHFAVLVDVSP